MKNYFFSFTAGQLSQNSLNINGFHKHNVENIQLLAFLLANSYYVLVLQVIEVVTEDVQAVEHQQPERAFCTKTPGDPAIAGLQMCG
ncbi:MULTISPECIES: hypothetical protein [Paenibacillus]|uniref:hypothetical protein n=1 Tax=Paenibacillus TaxID=44249 RepID=UPI0021161DBA|nr:hypothetical protein [Paenibacillus borealis]